MEGIKELGGWRIGRLGDFRLGDWEIGKRDGDLMWLWTKSASTGLWKGKEGRTRACGWLRDSPLMFAAAAIELPADGTAFNDKLGPHKAGFVAVGARYSMHGPKTITEFRLAHKRVTVRSIDRQFLRCVSRTSMGRRARAAGSSGVCRRLGRF